MLLEIISTSRSAVYGMHVACERLKKSFTYKYFKHVHVCISIGMYCIHRIVFITVYIQFGKNIEVDVEKFVFNKDKYVLMTDMPFIFQDMLLCQKIKLRGLSVSFNCI